MPPRWNKTLHPDDYEHLSEAVTLIEQHREQNPSWMFIHEAAYHRRWEYASLYVFAKEHLADHSLVVEFGSAASPGQGTPMGPMLALLGHTVIQSDLAPYVAQGVKAQNAIYDLSQQCIRQDARAFAIKSASVDFVCSISVVEHIADDHFVFSEMMRVLKPKGYLALTCDFSADSKYLHGTDFYNEDRIENRISLLRDMGADVDQYDYSDRSCYVRWAGVDYNFARLFAQKI